MIDVSDGGLCMLSPVELKPKQAVTLVLEVPPHGPVEVEAVAWNLRPVKNGRAGKKTWAIGMMVTQAGDVFASLLPKSPAAGIVASEPLPVEPEPVAQAETEPHEPECEVAPEAEPEPEPEPMDAPEPEPEPMEAQEPEVAADDPDESTPDEVELRAAADETEEADEAAVNAVEDDAYGAVSLTDEAQDEPPSIFQAAGTDEDTEANAPEEDAAAFHPAHAIDQDTAVLHADPEHEVDEDAAAFHPDHLGSDEDDEESDDDELSDEWESSAAEWDQLFAEAEAMFSGADEEGALQLFHVRVKATDGPRTRTLTLSASDESDATERARSDLGDAWKVLEAEPAEAGAASPAG